ncbi:hypothetical protein Tcan_14324 [Toxocara canis]|uniref:NtA domain-containing protein n=1 Tax=Toxocara canis TaxID=6265 RepID=A0A0B2V448_TOXCA|nr:hypothetical protein Tcan_14324 [Toxocara canis]
MFYVYTITAINAMLGSSSPSSSLFNCQFDRFAFNDSFQNAQVVITATVKQVTVDPRNNHLQTATVRVKRVIKGQQFVGRVHQVAIYGLGDIKYCRSVLYERDTKVILLREESGLLYLNSSLIPINLDVLDLIDAIIRALWRMCVRLTAEKLTR